MTTSWLTVAIASTQPNGSPDPDRVTPGLAGFLVVFLLALATLVLIRSMTKHLRKVRYSPDPAAAPDDDRAGATGDRTDASGAPDAPAGDGTGTEGARHTDAAQTDGADKGPRPPTG